MRYRNRPSKFRCDWILLKAHGILRPAIVLLAFLPVFGAGTTFAETPQVGDAQPGAKKITFTTLQTYLPTAPLRPSGLIGPVTLMAPQVAAK